MMAIDGKGALTIVEIKVAKSTCSVIANGQTISNIATASSGQCRRAGVHLRWRAIPSQRGGLIVADRYDAAVCPSGARSAAGTSAAEGGDFCDLHGERPRGCRPRSTRAWATTFSCLQLEAVEIVGFSVVSVVAGYFAQASIAASISRLRVSRFAYSRAE
jgi:hypothetical protein